jgi:hypothetical protein
MDSDSSRTPLPFEPNRKRKKKSGSSPDQSDAVAGKAKPKEVDRVASPRSRGNNSIPEVVGQRMLRRMLAFSGVPTFLGVGIFFISYFLIVRRIVDLPNYAVLFSTLGCFGLGVAGLSYGALSASWDEDRPGSWFGLDEFRVNFGRLTAAWNSSKENS